MACSTCGNDRVDVSLVEQGDRWLKVPPTLTRADRERVQQSMEALACKSSDAATVAIAFAAKGRSADAKECGPGMIYAEELARRLATAGARTCSELHGTVEGSDFIGTLRTCRVLVVVVTPAVYESRDCLEAISAALEEDLDILPVVFEGPTPSSKDEKWAGLGADDEQGQQQVFGVQSIGGRTSRTLLPLMGTSSLRLVIVTISMHAPRLDSRVRFFQVEGAGAKRLWEAQSDACTAGDHALLWIYCG